MIIGDKSLFHQPRKSLKGYFFSFAVLIIFLFTPSFVNAKTISILCSSDTPLYNNISTTIEQNTIENSNQPITFLRVYADSLDPAEIENIKKTDLLVTIGQRAMLSIKQFETSPPVMVTLVPSQSFNKHRSDLKKLNKKVSAVFIDSPPERQILLARILLGKKQTVAFLQSAQSSFSRKQISAITKKAGLRAQFENVLDADNIARKLALALEKSDALLALPDPIIFNRNTARNILLTTYRRRVPVIGFSANYVKAGALAATFSTTDQIALQTGKMISNILRDNTRFPYGGHFPEDFEIEVNTNVARSLSISLIPKAQIKQELKILLENTK